MARRLVPFSYSNSRQRRANRRMRINPPDLSFRTCCVRGTTKKLAVLHCGTTRSPKGARARIQDASPPEGEGAAPTDYASHGKALALRMSDHDGEKEFCGQTPRW